MAVVIQFLIIAQDAENGNRQKRKNRSGAVNAAHFVDLGLHKKCSLFVLPSRQECWGLVINEAASYGIPIVSTYGSGAAVEFLSKDYPQYLAIPGDAQSLLRCIESALNADREEYSRYLIEKSKQYSIEKGVKAHTEAFEL